MPFVYLGTGWLIGIWAAPALNLPVEVLFLVGLIALIGFALWRDSRRAMLIWLGVLFAAIGGGRYLLSIPHFDHTSLSTYNDIGEVTIEGVIVAEPDVRDTYINLRITPIGSRCPISKPTRSTACCSRGPHARMICATAIECA